MARLKWVVAWFAFLVVPIVASVAGFFLTAKITPRVEGLIIGGLLAVAVSAYLLAGRPIGRSHRARGAAAFVFAVLVGVLGWALLFHRPAPTALTYPARSVPFETWELSTGSRVAVARFHGAATTPIVFLHGGPGAYVREEEVTFFNALSGRGFDIVAYDQAGGGASEKLGVGNYTVARAVADLEAIRVRLGVEKISLLGSSWGGRLAYEYIAAHPDRLERVAVLSPGPLRKNTDDFVLTRTAAANGAPGPPAYLVAMFLLYNLNPDAALAFMPRDEADVVMGNMVPNLAARSACRGVRPPDWRPSGGLDALQLLQLKKEMNSKDAPPVTSVPPVLQLRSECDFVRWDIAKDYRERLHANMVYIPGAPHTMWPARTDLVLDVLASFFNGQPSPVPYYTADAEPPAQQ